MKNIIALGVALICLSGTLTAQSFVNSSFESPALGVSEPGPAGVNFFSGWLGTNSDGLVGGWTWASGGVTTAGNWLSPIAPAPDGTQYGFLISSPSNPAGSATMSQTITLPTNGVYSISFYAGSGSTAYSTENVTLQLDGATVGHWNAATFGSSMVQVGTNFFASAGSHTFTFVTDTNGATIGSDGYGLCFDLVTMSPYYAAYTANDSLQQVYSDGSYQGTFNGLSYIAGKAQDGWTLYIGTNGGSYNWGSQLNFTLPNITTIAGSSPTNRPTIIFTNVNECGIYLNPGSFVTLRDLIFNSGTVSPDESIVGIDGTNVCFRVSNCQLLNAALGSPASPGTRFGIQVCTGHNNAHFLGPWGLIDSCQFDFPGGVVYNYINCRANGTLNPDGTVLGWGWSNSMTWGTTNSVIVESCSASQPSPIPINGFAEGDGGARITLRYCNLTNVEESTHGSESGSHTSTLQVEQYMNQFVVNGALQVDYWYVQRGGSGVIWSNTYLNELTGGASTLTTTMKFWDENAGTNSSYQNFIPAGSVYNGSGVFVYSVTNNTSGAGPYYQFWGGVNDTSFGFGTNSTGSGTATYTAIANNVGTPQFSTNFPQVYMYLKGTPNATVTCGIRDVSQDDWWQETKSASSRLFYPTNYPSFEQNGQGSANNAQISQPIYIWGNVFAASQFQGIILGHDSGDSPFIQQGRDIFTNTVMPGYTPLAYPHPLVNASTNGGGGQGFSGSQPSITQQPLDASFAVGQPTFFGVSATGSTPLEYQWYFGTNAIASATNSSVTGTASTPGVFKVSCVVTNNYGSVTSRLASETIYLNGSVTGATPPAYLTQ